MNSNRITLISADCHATARAKDYVQYLEPEFRKDFEATLSAWNGVADLQDAIYTEEALAKFKEEAAAVDDKALLEGQWDSELRRKALEADGVVAEVIFPNGSPFMEGPGLPIPTPEQERAGKKAYNRWLADFCAELPGRRAGIAQLEMTDVKEAVAEVEWAAKAGLKGVEISSIGGRGIVPLYDPKFEPLWSAAEGAGLAVHFHGGGSMQYSTDDPALKFLLLASETTYFSRQPLFFLVWSGVLERHPKLKVVFTETTTQWVPEAISWMDAIFKADFRFKGPVSRLPSEYWHRQCFIGASMLTDKECDMRYEIGVDTMMFGVDFPHLEGTWPKTKSWLQASVGGVPEPELRSMLGETAARVYGFDMPTLQHLANRIGPAVSEFAQRTGSLRPGRGAGR